MVGQNPQNPDSSPPRRIDELREHEEVNEELEFDIDELKAQFDIDKILEAIDSLSNQVTNRKVNEPKGFSKRTKLTAQATT